MTAPVERRKALILSAIGAPKQHDEVRQLRVNIHAARLYNFIEFLDSLGWDAEIGEIRAKPTAWFEKVIWVRHGPSRGERPEAHWALGIDLDEIELDWRDIDEFTPGTGDLAVLSHWCGRTSADTVRDWLTASRPDPDEPPDADRSASRLPVVIGCGAGLRAVWTSDGMLDSDALGSWNEVETTDADSTSSYAVSADGRMVVVARDRVITVSWLTATKEGPTYIPDRRGDIRLPDSVGPRPRVVSVATMLGGTTRLTIADSTDTRRLFLTPGGEISGRPIHSQPATISVGIDVLSQAVLYKSDGRQVHLGNGETMFPGLKVHAVDAAFSRGVTVVAALGRRSGHPEIQIGRRLGTARWELISIMDELHELGVEASTIVDVTVERRLDDLEPSHLVIAVGQTPHVIALPTGTRAASTREFGGIGL